MAAQLTVGQLTYLRGVARDVTDEALFSGALQTALDQLDGKPGVKINDQQREEIARVMGYESHDENRDVALATLLAILDERAAAQ